MTQDLLSRISISDVWTALGGQVPRHGRAPAFWRRTRDFNVSLNDEKGTWYDFARGEGGGVLDLVQHIRGGDRKDATRWLADYAGIPLDRPLSAAERRDYARRKAVAQREACELIGWRNRMLTALREYRDTSFGAYHRARRYISTHSLDSPAGDLAADVCDVYERRYQDLDRRIDALLAAPWPVLRDLYRQRRAAA